MATQQQKNKAAEEAAADALAAAEKEAAEKAALEQAEKDAKEKESKAVSEIMGKTKKIYVFSTLSNDCAFTVWINPPQSAQDQGRLPSRKSVILIKGRANVANKKTLESPRGAITEITPEQYEALKTIPTFVRKVERAFLQVSDGKENAAEFAKENMESKDKSAQLTKNDPGMNNATANSDRKEA